MIRREMPEEFYVDGPLPVPFECEHCTFKTTNSRDAASHADFHNDLVKTTSRLAVVSTDSGLGYRGKPTK